MADLPCCNPCIECDPSVSVGAFGINAGVNDPSNPFLNISSAAPDENLFIGRYYIPPQEPPLGSVWYAPVCATFCISAVSQADADLCAKNKGVECLSNNWPVTVPNPDAGTNPPPGFPTPDPTIQIPRNTFTNTAQTCSTTCPDGSEFSYTVPAGAVSALSQAAANTQATIMACEQAILRRICIGDADFDAVCVGTEFNTEISVSAAMGTEFTAIVTDGSLPPGLSLSQTEDSVVIVGTATTAGDYPFTLQVTDNFGNVKLKSFSITIAGIDGSGTLTNGTIGNPYSHTFTATGTSGTVTWSLASGSMPDGLSLSSGGVLSGTPTGSAASHLLVIQMDDGFVTCTKEFTLTIDGGVDWTQLEWNTIIHTDTNGAVSSFSPTGGIQSNSFSGGSQAPYDAGLVVSGRIVVSGTMMYSGPAINAEVQASVLINNLILGQGGNTFMQIAWYKAGGFQSQVGGSNPSVGALTLPIVSAAIGAPVEIRIDVDFRASDGGALQSNPVVISGNGTVVNV